MGTRLHILARGAALLALVSLSGCLSLGIRAVPPPPGEIRIISPNGGERFAGGTVQSVIFDGGTNAIAAGSVKIEYSTDGATWVAVAAGLPDSAYSWTLPSIDSGSVKVRVSARLSNGNSLVGESSAAFLVDSLAPVFTAGQMQVQSGAATASVNNVRVNLSAADTGGITHYCLKYNLTATPAASDPCWVATSPTTTLSLDTYKLLGFQPGAYALYAWARDEFGHISTLSGGGSGTAGLDRDDITFTPVLPPTVTGISASAANGSIVQTIPAANTVYIKWTASSAAALIASPISIYYTTDDRNYTLVQAALANSAGAGCTIAGAETGCYTWTNGAPAATFFRIRIGATDVNGRTSYSSSPEINVGTTLRVLAGVVDPGTDGDSMAASFVTESLFSGGGGTNPQSLLINAAGIIYFRDSTRGILRIDPANGLQKLVVPTTGTATDGALPGATLRLPLRIAFDSQEKILIFDYDRIRLYDPVGNTVSTLIGGGAMTTDGVAPLQVSITPAWTTSQLMLLGTPDGKVYFRSENYSNPLVSALRIRIYDPAAGTVTSRSLGGTGDGSNASQDIALCMGTDIAATYHPVTGVLGQYVLNTAWGSAGCGASGTYTFAVLDPATGQSSGPHPVPADYLQGLVTGRDGQIYLIRRLAGLIQKYNPVTRSFATIVGNGSLGTCADDTLAAACSVDPIDLYATAAGQIYFNDRGRIRTIDQAGKVFTVAGSGVTAGDGAPAIYAKMGLVQEVKLWNDGSNDRIVLADQSDPRIREFVVGGNIQTLAGNGTNGTPNTTAAANTQPLRYHYSGEIINLSFQVHPTTGNIYSSRGENVAYLNRGTGMWVNLVGGGGTNFSSGDGMIGSALRFHSWAPRVFGFNGTSLLVSASVYLVAGYYKTYLITNGTQSPLIGNGSLYGPFAANGTAGTASTAPVPTSGMPASWDSVNSRWVFVDSTNEYVVRTLAPGGNLGTLATVSGGVRGFAYRKDGGNDVIYYCNHSTQALNRYNVTTSSWSAYTLPIPNMRCDGKSMIYSTSRGSLIFSFTQNGLGGVAELLSP